MPRSQVGIRAAALSLAAVLLAGLSGCGLPLFTATETISEVFETGAAPTIVVETFNGSIDISNGADDEVVVEVTRRAGGFDQRSADENLERVEVSLVENDGEIQILASRQGHFPGDAGASVIIAAPLAAKIRLKTSNAYIVSEGMRGGIDANTSNARIGVYEATGQIDATTSNAQVEIEAIDATVDAGTSNARIRFRGDLADEDQRFRTSNASIDVVLPPDSQFRFDAVTSNARVDCEFPFVGDESKRRRKLRGTVGDDPRSSLELSTSNASIDIRRAE